jgi:TonB family protein
MKVLLVTLASITVALAQSGETPKVPANVTAPALLYRVEPEYTAEARSKGVEGVATLYAEVTKDGNAANIRVIKSLDPGLDAKAIAAVTQWRFRPAQRDGRAVSVAATIDVQFQMPKHPMLPNASPQPQAPLPGIDWAGVLQLLQLAPVQ